MPRKRSKKRINREPQKYTPAELAEIRLNYCAGMMALAKVALHYKMTVDRLHKLGKEHGWKRKRYKTPRGKQVENGAIKGPQEIVYLGPLTEGERAKVDAITAQRDEDVLVLHRGVSYKALYLANQQLDRMLADNGMVKITKQVAGGEPTEYTVPGLDALDKIAGIISKTIPLDRISAGLDPHKGMAGKKDDDARSDEQHRAFLAELHDHFQKRLEAARAVPVVSGDVISLPA